MTSPAFTLPHRGLNARQVETVGKLYDAARASLDESPYDDLTIRIVATHAGVSAATAYTYFSSKDHLFASLFWRNIAESELPELAGDPVQRLQQTVRHLADLIAASPSLASAASKSLLGAEPEVGRLRRTIGRHWVDVFSAALGEAAEPELLRALIFAFSGALLEAGMGILHYQDLADQLESTVAVIARGNT